VVGPVLIALGAMLIGNALGLVAGYFGGALDSAISRCVDLVYALPALLVAIVVVGVLGGGYFLAVALLVVLFSPVDTRIVRARHSTSARDPTSRPRASSDCLRDESC
jgi:ABC-type dipeptide/oligopeptide/nickel transport system permease subunit